VNTEYFRIFIEKNENETAKRRRFPDEYYASNVQALKDSHPEVVTEIMKLMSSAQGLEILNRWRFSKTYKTLPRSLTDEDRLFYTLLAWNLRFGPILKNNPGSKGQQMVDEIMLKYEGIDY
jgi:hypothetical protein